MRFLELKELQVLLGLPRSWRSGEGTIASRCPRQHSHKRLIPKDPMVDECSSGVECSEGHKDVCKELVHHVRTGGQYPQPRQQPKERKRA